ncbi:VOC family protein [Nocardioides sp. AE5]|uniref:VOC family protein n=1 Tax=Nocardioides sp. AE5 TaxID=2962573 RepID=UPI0028822116|nr:VOC family protein [Nocardioides sp. AE5]MDT0203156.1 VOC family protein [Nocardioides sp. AE5]
MITKCDHIGIQVEDLDRSIAFYAGALGFELRERFIKSEPYLQELVGCPGAELDIAIMGIPSTEVELEILEYRRVARRAVDPNTANPGTGHFCLFVTDLDEIVERAHEFGGGSVSPVQTSTAGPVAGSRLVYLTDPDGIRVELVERH